MRGYRSFLIRVLRKRWFLGLIFLFSLFYFLDRTLNQIPQDLTYQISDTVLIEPTRAGLKIRVESHNKNITTCRNSGQGRSLIVDEKGYVCQWQDMLPSGCCDPTAVNSRHYTCRGCSNNHCCAVYEHCVSCCLHPEKENVLKEFLNKASNTFRLLFQVTEDHYEVCLLKCRTSSESVQHENTYRDPIAKHCYGDKQPELMIAT